MHFVEHRLFAPREPHQPCFNVLLQLLDGAFRLQKLLDREELRALQLCRRVGILFPRDLQELRLPLTHLGVVKVFVSLQKKAPT